MRQGLPRAVHRQGDGRTCDEGIRRGDARKRLHARRPAAGARRAHLYRTGQDEQRLRLLLPQRRHQARARRPCGAVDFGRRRSQLAAAPPPGDVHADRGGDRARRRRQHHGVDERPRSAEPAGGPPRHLPQAGFVRRRAQGAALQPYAVHADVPLVGERRGEGARPVRKLLPSGCHLCRGPRRARDVEFPGGEQFLLRRRLHEASGREQPRVVQKHPRSDLLHGVRDGIRFLRRLRPRGARRIRPCRRPPYRARQEAVDVGQPSVRVCVGPRADRRQRTLRGADGRRLYRQPARLHLSPAVRDEGLQPVLVAVQEPRPREERQYAPCRVARRRQGRCRRFREYRGCGGSPWRRQVLHCRSQGRRAVDVRDGCDCGSGRQERRNAD